MFRHLFDTGDAMTQNRSVPKRRKRATDEERLASLEKRGIVRRGRSDPRKLLRFKPIKIPGANLVEAIIEERESGW